MTTLREAAQQALEALEGKRYTACGWRSDCDKAITALKAALAEPTPLEDVVTYGSAWSKEGKRIDPMSVYAEPVQEPVQEPKPVEFDHGIGADRFKVVRGAFWWHVLIGDSPTEHGKFRSRASAEKMAADLLREFRNGAFVQHEAALAEPVQEPCTYKCETWPECECAKPWQSAPPQRPAEPVQEPDSPERRCGGPGCDMTCCQPVQEPVAVTVEAVAEVIEKDGEPELCWLIEGGIYALAEGDILMIAHRSITGDDGSGEVYTAPPQNKENT